MFGKPLSVMQNTQFKMAELRAELDITQCYVDQAALAFNEGTLSAEDAAMAKLKTSELQQRVAMRVCSCTVGQALWMNTLSVDNRPMPKLRQFMLAALKS